MRSPDDVTSTVGYDDSVIEQVIEHDLAICALRRWVAGLVTSNLLLSGALLLVSLSGVVNGRA